MEIKGTNARVFIVNKETGERKELQGVTDISLQEQINEDLKAKLNIPKGPYTWTAKATCRTHFTRKMRKDFRRVFFTQRQRKYVAKAYLVRWILEYDVTNVKTEQQLMKLSHRELTKILIPIAFMVIEGERRKAYERISRKYPSAGIVPSGDIKPNTGETVVTKEQMKELL